jgi:hypothetical protein
MEGVTILNATKSLPELSGILIFVGIVFGILACILGMLNFNPSYDGLFVGATILIPFIFIFVAVQCPKVTTYQVIIDDSVSMNEFIGTYNIIKQEGQIYTVTLREKS